MPISNTVKDLENTIRLVARRLKKDKEGPGADTLTALAKLVNSYRQLLQTTKGISSRPGKMNEEELLEEGDPAHAEMLRRS